MALIIYFTCILGLYYRDVTVTMRDAAAAPSRLALALALARAGRARRARHVRALPRSVR